MPDILVRPTSILGLNNRGESVPITSTSDGHLEVSLPLTAFGDLRIAELTPILQISFEYTVSNTEIRTKTVAGSGAVSQSEAMCVVNTGSTTASTASWKTKRHAKYKSGLGGLARFTGLFTTGVVGTTQVVGLVDEVGSSATYKNGYAVGYDGVNFSFLRWQNDVAFHIPQSSWDDPMDGTGASGMTLDTTKLNVFFIQFQYLGAGAIKLFIEDDATGSMVLVHTSLYTNLNTTPSVHNPNFHLTVAAFNNATTADLTVKSASMAYFTEGKAKYYELQQPQFSSGLKTKNTVTTEIALFTIRNKSTYASKTNYIDILLENIGGSIEASSANNLGSLRLILNATLGGTPSYADISTTDSVVEIDTAGTTVTGGKTLQAIALAGKNDRISGGGDLTPYDIILQAGDTVTVAGTSANSATINASLLWKELF